MSMLCEEKERASDSPYVEAVMYGRTASEGTVIRPAENHWHLVIVRHQSGVLPIITGPLTTSGVVSFTPDVELLWIKFKLGAYMPHLPLKNVLNVETNLPEATRQTFWLKGSAWQLPDYENADTFVDRLVRDEVLVCDPVVTAVLDGQPPDMASRTVRHRFLNTTGLTQNHIHQVKRAQQAADLLKQGTSILDTVHEAGYFDQAHLTRALKQWVGYTPAQLVQSLKPPCSTPETE